MESRFGLQGHDLACPGRVPAASPERSALYRVVERPLDAYLAFSCRTRNFCPSCQAKWSALLAEHLRFRVSAPVPHRHVVFTIPKALRGVFERERRLLGLLSRCAYETVRRTWGVGFGVPGSRPGMVCSIQTFGSFAANLHPHAPRFAGTRKAGR